MGETGGFKGGVGLGWDWSGAWRRMTEKVCAPEVGRLASSGGSYAEGPCMYKDEMIRQIRDRWGEGACLKEYIPPDSLWLVESPGDRLAR